MDVHIRRAVISALRLRSKDVLTAQETERPSWTMTIYCNGRQNLVGFWFRRMRISSVRERARLREQKDCFACAVCVPGRLAVVRFDPALAIRNELRIVAIRQLGIERKRTCLPVRDAGECSFDFGASEFSRYFRAASRLYVLRPVKKTSVERIRRCVLMQAGSLLFLAQRLQRIDLHRPAGRHITG